MNQPDIHPTAIIDDGAQIASGAKIGPFCVIGPNVKLGTVNLHAHVVISGHTAIGDGTEIHAFAALGGDPQDLKFKGEITTLEIGKNCVIREGVTMNTGTAGGGGATRVGNNSVFLTQSHVAHDCNVGDHVIFSNNVMLAGHCTVENNVIIGGGAGIHQFVRIGAHAFVGGLAGVEQDVIPYGMALGNRAYLSGLNLVGLKRLGLPRETIHNLRTVYKQLFAAEQGVLSERLEKISHTYPNDIEVNKIVNFIANGGERALCMPRKKAFSQTE